MTTSTTEGSALEHLFDDLAATPTARLPFQHDVVLRSYVLRRSVGNVLVYSSPGLTAAADEIERLGPPTRLLLNHEHESMFGQPDLDVPTWVHADDRAAIGDSMRIAGAFDGPTTIGEDLHVIPTPGHTPGTTSYLWDSGRHRYLFTGDFLWIEQGEWKAVVLDPSLRADYVASLELVRDLDFDVLVPWGVTEGHPPVGIVRDDAEKRDRVTAVIDRVAAGENR